MKPKKSEKDMSVAPGLYWL